MAEVNDRLARCFSSVFPVASPEEIREVELESMPGWDSLRGVALVTVIDEEFGVQIDLPDLLELKSFDAIQQYIVKHASAS